MATNYHLPKVADMKDMLVMLFGDDAVVKPGKPLEVKAGAGSMVATYIADDGTPVAVSVCDVPFAAFAGSSLSLIPAGSAKDAAKTGTLSEVMWGNLREVMNILSRLLMDPDTPHLKLDLLYKDPKELPQNVLAMIKGAKGRADFEIVIPRYGNGRLSFLAT